jgi:hypothetical protein
MKRIFQNGRYANVTSTMALVVALGGTSYAAIKLPANSVTSKTVKDRSLLSYTYTESGPAIAAGDQTIESIALRGGGNWVVTAKFVANNTSVAGSTLDCRLTIGGAAKDSLGAGGTDFGPGGSAHTLTGAGVGTSAAIVCTTGTSAPAGSYDAISITALRVSSIS